MGGALTAGEPLSLDTWSLPAVIEHMQDAYCGTLTVELDHLASQYASPCFCLIPLQSMHCIDMRLYGLPTVAGT